MINNHPESIGPSSQDPSTEWGGDASLRDDRTAGMAYISKMDVES